MLAEVEAQLEATAAVPVAVAVEEQTCLQTDSPWVIDQLSLLCSEASREASLVEGKFVGVRQVLEKGLIEYSQLRQVL